MLYSFLRRWLGTTSKPSTRITRPQRFRATLEALEDRSVPAVISVTGPGDVSAVYGPLTSRAALESANRNNSLGDGATIGAIHSSRLLSGRSALLPRGPLIDWSKWVKVAPITPLFAVGSGEGGAGTVLVYNSKGSLRFSLKPFASYGYIGGVSVATGDVNGDGVEDVVAGANGQVKVFDGKKGVEIRFFNAYPGLVGVTYVAAGDINGDGLADIFTGSGLGHVKVFDAVCNAEVRSFLPYVGYNGPVTVAAGDINGDGLADIVTGSGLNGHVKVFDAVTNAEVRSFLAYVGFPGAVFVAAGDINGDGKDDIITGAGAGNPGGHVKVFDAVTNAEVRSFLATDYSFTGGVHVAAKDIDGDGCADLVLGVAYSAVKVLRGADLAVLYSFFPFGKGLLGTVSVG